VDLNHWNVRKDGHLILRPNVPPMGVYVSFDPTKRKFFRHNVYPLDTSDAWLPMEPARISSSAVAEAIAYALVGRADGKP